MNQPNENAGIFFWVNGFLYGWGSFEQSVLQTMGPVGCPTYLYVQSLNASNDSNGNVSYLQNTNSFHLYR
ncbi:hypothetical protein XELAEV_18042655mg [Xenopus laevis]|uniref:Uncharacterized protein n=1 Tax=Xenopus laevis TaxID=8355 RepID=A0A974C4N0_XENLA|nr:hypothetical protein XELAEV_18042655mg [Xenopus laevis]